MNGNEQKRKETMKNSFTFHFLDGKLSSYKPILLFLLGLFI
jgi:hypothetical protein